jgi:hypothetical protein
LGRDHTTPVGTPSVIPVSPSHIYQWGGFNFFQEAWHRSTSNRWVLEIISQGYSLEFIRVPEFSGVRPTPLNKGPGKGVLLEEVQSLLKKQALEPVPVDQDDCFYSTFFLVPKKGKDWRPILNLSL